MQEKKREKTTKEEVNYDEVALNVSFSDTRYNDMYKEYIRIKNALVQADAAEAKKGGENIGTTFANIGVDHELMQVAAEIAGSDDLKTQRKAFSDLSNAITELVSKAHIASGKIYKQYCPMAFDFKGAYWLSTEKQIRNPYFGDQMLECGEVKQEIQ